MEDRRQQLPRCLARFDFGREMDFNLADGWWTAKLAWSNGLALRQGWVFGWQIDRLYPRGLLPPRTRPLYRFARRSSAEAAFRCLCTGLRLALAAEARATADELRRDADVEVAIVALEDWAKWKADRYNP